VIQTHAGDLRALEQRFRNRDPTYPLERDRLLKLDPKLAPWLAKVMVWYAVGDNDKLTQHGLAAEQLEGVKGTEQRTLFLARDELKRLGGAGRAAIRYYLVRDRRTQLRDLGCWLLRVHDPDEVIAMADDELHKGPASSKRAVLRLLGYFGRHDSAKRLLDEFARSEDWQLRGTAVRALARRVPRAEVDQRQAFLWDVFEHDSDAWVRQEALRALGDLGDVTQVRRLVTTLEGLLKADRPREARAVGAALKALTGHGYGTKVSRWRTWLGTRR